MQKKMLFSAIADFYEYSMQTNCDYKMWAQYVLNRIKSFKEPSVSVKGIDVACGTGYFTRVLKKAGYDVCGCDLSPEMLTFAKQKCADEKLVIPFYVQDMTNLKSFEKVDFITVINDGINFLPPKKISKAFLSFAKCLKKGGILHFDISSEYKLKNIIANETFCEDDENYSYIWFNKLFEDRVQMDMSVFIKKGELYEKRESSLTEYIYSADFLLDALKNAGFKVAFCEGALGETFTNTSERFNVTAVKI